MCMMSMMTMEDLEVDHKYDPLSFSKKKKKYDPLRS